MASQDLKVTLKLVDKLSGPLNKTNSALKDLGLTIAKGAMVVGIAKLVKDSTLLAARVETLGVVTAHMGEQMGMTEKQVRALEQSIVDQGITLQHSRQIIAQMIQSNIDLSEATDLARMAQDAAVIANINSSEAAQKLIYVLQTGNVRMARTMGLNVSFAKSYQELADEIGVTVNALNEEQIMQARVNAVKKAGARISGVYEKAMGTAGKQLLSLPRHIDAFKVALGNLFIPVLGEAVEAFGSFLDILTEGLETLDLLIHRTELIDAIFAEHQAEVLGTAETYEEYNAEMERAYEATGRTREAIQGLRPAYAKLRDELEWLTEEEWENHQAGKELYNQFMLLKGILNEGKGAAFNFAEALRGLTEAQFLEMAAEAILAGNFVAAQYYADMAYQAEIAEGNTRKLIAALDALDGKKVTSEIWIKTFGATELGIVGAQQARSFVASTATSGWNPAGETKGRQHGGPLPGGLAKVGEAGWEYIWDGVVIPHSLSKQLEKLGMGGRKTPGFQGGGGLPSSFMGFPSTRIDKTVLSPKWGAPPGTLRDAGLINIMQGGGGAGAAIAPAAMAAATVATQAAEAAVEAAVVGAIVPQVTQQTAAMTSQMRAQRLEVRETNKLLTRVVALLGNMPTTDEQREIALETEETSGF